MKTIIIATRKKDEVVDITETVEISLQEMQIENGVCALFVSHTTCALTTADLDPGTDLDFLDALRRLLPKMSYRHPHDPSHARSYPLLNSRPVSYYPIHKWQTASGHVAAYHPS